MRRVRALVFLVILAMLGTTTVCLAVELDSKALIQTKVWYKPTFLPSVNAAIGTLRNLGGRKAFCGWNGYNDGLDVNVDSYGLRVRGIMVTTGTQYVPTSGGYWVGWRYVPYYGGTYQPTKSESTETAVVEFKKVRSIHILHYPNLSRDNKWGVDVYHTDREEIVAYRMPTLETAREFADAVATLSVAAGSRLTHDGIWLAYSAKAKLLKKLKWTAGYGLVITDVAPGSPAADAKLQENDILIEANGVVLRDNLQYRQLLQDILGDKNEVPIELKVVRAGQQQMFSFTLANFNIGAANIQKLGQPTAPVQAKPSLGLELAALTAEEAKAAGIAGGLKIIALKPDGVAAKSQLKVNDILLAVNGQPTLNTEALRRVLAAEPPKQFQVWRGAAVLTIEAVQSF